MPRTKVCWNRPLPVFAGKANVYFAFVPNRAHVAEVAIEAAHAELLRGHRLPIWRARAIDLKRAALELEVQWNGELPQLIALSAHDASAADSDTAGTAAVTAQSDAQYVALLEARAALCHDGPRDPDRRFFLRFDAWTNPKLAAALRSDEFAAKLNAQAKALFIDAPLKTFPLEESDTLIEVAICLRQHAIERAERLLNGDRAIPALPASFGTSIAPWRTVAEVLDAIAEYVARIFEAHFPSGASQGRSAAAPPALERAFARFASGALAFVDPAEPDPIKTWLNAEPDSALFFAFAELALRATTHLPSAATYWHSLARLFVALEDVFIATYGPPLGPREIEIYQREKRRGGPPIPLPVIEEHLDRFRDEYHTLADHDKLTMVHECNVLHAARDEIVTRSGG